MGYTASGPHSTRGSLRGCSLDANVVGDRPQDTSVAATRFRVAAIGAAAGQALDWLILAAVIALVAGAVFTGLVFMPAAGFVQSRAPLALFEHAAALIGTAALARWILFGGRALPGALLVVLSAITALDLLQLVTTSDLYQTRDAVFLHASIVVVALAVVMSASDARKTRIFLGGLALLGVAEAIIGLGQYTRGAETPIYWLSRTFAVAIRTRIHGTLGNPNVLATFLLTGIGATALLAVDQRGVKRFLLLAGLCVQIGAIALTYSRGGYAGLAALLLLGAVFLWPVRRRAGPVFITASVMASLSLLALPAVGLRAGSVTLDGADTTRSRLFIWQTAVRMWHARPAWGTGIGAFNAAYAAHRPSGVLTTYAMVRIPGSAHNDYLQLLAETGVGGVAMLVLATGWGVWRVARRYRAGSEEERIWLGTWAATIAGLGVSSVANSTVSSIPAAMMLGVFTAAVAAHLSSDRRPLHHPQRWLALPLAALVLGLPPLLPAPTQASAYQQEAGRHVRAGRYKEAVEAFQRAAEADPLNGAGLAYFGDLQADLYLRRVDSSAGPWRTARERAADLYGRAQRLSPWDGYPSAGLGRLRRAERRFPDAVAALRQAIVLDGYSPRYHLWLGETLLEMGDRRGAAAQLAEAVRLFPIEMLAIERHEGRSASFDLDAADLADAHRLLSRAGVMAP
jgi:O-Antigen ligase